MPPSTAAEVVSIGERLPFGETKDVTWDMVGNAVHAFLAADVAGLERDQRMQRAHRILVVSSLAALLTADALLRGGDQLRAWAHARWPGATWHREYPVTGRVATAAGSRRVHGTIDLLLETRDVVVLVDHKSFPGDASRLASRALEFVPQLAAYAWVLSAAKERVLGSYVHFAVGAAVVELDESPEPARIVNRGRAVASSTPVPAEILRMLEEVRDLGELLAARMCDPVGSPLGQSRQPPELDRPMHQRIPA